MNMNPKQFKTFTAGYDESKEVDERYYSNFIVEDSGCTNIIVKPTADKLIRDFERVIWHQDEPFGGLSVFAGWCVMEAASQNGVKVLLDGQGGDETLLGYERFYAYMLIDKIKKFNIGEAIKDFKLASENSRLTKNMLLGYLFYFNSIYIRKKWLKIKNRKFLNPEFLDRFVDKNIVDTSLKFKNFNDVKTNAINNSLSHLLRYEDRNTMAHSIEARVPFLDYNFVEKAYNLPTEYKLRGGWTKACLRKFMENKMPKEVTYRKNKLGFSVPQKKWVDELNDHFAQELLQNPRSKKYFNIDSIRMAFNEKTNTDIRVRFIIVELWMRIFDLN